MDRRDVGFRRHGPHRYAAQCGDFLPRVPRAAEAPAPRVA
jgi:hypothetical protein